jgi:pimeloyl-ACP methyl ester carboxylesterase
LREEAKVASGVGTAANGVEVAYETMGDPAAPPVLLVMGLGAPMVAWHPELCAMFATGGFVAHGDRDPLISVSAGRVTAELIAGAGLVAVPGMGHDLPRGMWRPVVDASSAVAERRADPIARTEHQPQPEKEGTR